jgi:hypothetical protein
MTRSRKRARREMLRQWRAELELTLRALGIVRTLEDMSEEEIQALEKQYGMPVRRPQKKEAT